MRVSATFLQAALILGVVSSVSAEAIPAPTVPAKRADAAPAAATPTSDGSDPVSINVASNPEVAGTQNLPAALSKLLFPTSFPTLPFPKILGISLGSNNLGQTSQNGGSLLGSLNAPQLPQFLGNTNPFAKVNGGGAVPNTGVTRTYNFNIARATLAPDGVARQVLVVNGQFPGPTIEANWGDTIRVTVFNNIQGPQEGTGLHWHGLTQKRTEFMDGTPGVAQCPIAPGTFFTYQFVADQFGTSWWHAHYSAQYSGGAYGAMIVYGPNANAQYDADLGPVFLTDWFHRDYNTIVAEVMGTDLTKVRPVAENNLINGKGNFNCSLITNGQQCTPNAGLSKFKFQSGKTYRLRLINSGSEAIQRFSIDNHALTVIASDFVPIQPYNTNVLTIGVGQRYDVLVKATGVANGAYYMRSTIPVPCSLASQPNALAMVYYQNADTNSEPTTKPWPNTNNACANDPLNLLVPYYPQTPPAGAVQVPLAVNFVINATGHFLWTMNGVSYRTNFNKPLLQSVLSGVLSYPTSYSVVNTGSASSYILVVTNQAPGAHPMHLHGHNFWILNEGQGTWDGTIVNPSNPPRRDTIILQQGGYIAIQVLADNPGMWPFHCHIAWHVSAGLYANILERPRDISSFIQQPLLNSNLCVTWSLWTLLNRPNQIDSGLRMMEKNKMKRDTSLRREALVEKKNI